MNKNSIPLFIGVMCSFVVIWLVNDYFLVDKCLDHGGSFDYKKAECLLKNGDVKPSELSSSFIALYFFMGFLISLVVSFSYS